MTGVASAPLPGRGGTGWGRRGTLGDMAVAQAARGVVRGGRMACCGRELSPAARAHGRIGVGDVGMQPAHGRSRGLIRGRGTAREAGRVR